MSSISAVSISPHLTSAAAADDSTTPQIVLLLPAGAAAGDHGGGRKSRSDASPPRPPGPQILLDPKSLLRCRAVARAWRCAASARHLLLAHHARQPNLPIIYGSHSAPFSVGDIIPVPFDRRAADPLQPVARFHPDIFSIEASCEGLLVLSLCVEQTSFAICNPATRQYAPLPTLSAFMVLGMYLHGPTGEHRLLLYKSQLLRPTPVTEGQDGSYVFTLGSGQPPRLIGWPDAELLACGPPSVLLHGNLHWHLMQYEADESESNVIMVFDTTAESFRQMRAPDDLFRVDLFETDGMLGLSSLTGAATITSIDIWLMQDYETEVWALKYRVGLQIQSYWDYLSTPWDGGVLVLLKPEDYLLQIDIDGKVVAGFHHRGLNPTPHWLKQSLVSHTFFPTLEGYAVNALPFI